MKKSNIIIIVLGGLILCLLLVIFSISKHNTEFQPRDYNSKKYTLKNISTIVFDKQIKCYVKSGDCTVIDFRYWGNDEVMPEKLCIKNDTLYLNFQFNKPESCIQISCKNVKKFIVKNKSFITINQFASDALNIRVLSKSQVNLNCLDNMKNDSTKNILNINFDINDRSVVGISNSTVDNIKVLAKNSTLSLQDSKFKRVNLDLRSGSQIYEWHIKCSESFQLKSDNKSQYYIQYNYNEKK